MLRKHAFMPLCWTAPPAAVAVSATSAMLCFWVDVNSSVLTQVGSIGTTCRQEGGPSHETRTFSARTFSLPRRFSWVAGLSEAVSAVLECTSAAAENAPTRPEGTEAGRMRIGRADDSMRVDDNASLDRNDPVLGLPELLGDAMRGDVAGLSELLCDAILMLRCEAPS